jgi:hypothetical protein
MANVNRFECGIFKAHFLNVAPRYVTANAIGCGVNKCIAARFDLFFGQFHRCSSSFVGRIAHE